MTLRKALVAATLSVTVIAAPLVAHGAGPGDGTLYEIQPGDSLYGIAARHDVSLASLLRVNDLTISSVILPGQQLRLPADATTPAATPAATPSTSSTTSGGTHTVVWGDSLYGIAARHGVSVASLMAANDLSIASLILPGQQLRLPAGVTTAAATPSTTSTAAAKPSTTSNAGAGTHTVVWGDSLYGIAVRHGVSVASLMRANDLTLTSLLLPGQQLRLPAGATSPAATPTQPTSPAATPTPPPTPSADTGNTTVAKVVDYARAQLGKPYRFFTRGPDTFDCSGLTVAAYAQAGISLIHYSAAQALQGTAVDFRNEAIQPGDLVFLKQRGSTSINHVGIAVSSNTWIHATGPGDTVRIGSMPATSTISAVRRYIDS